LRENILIYFVTSLSSRVAYRTIKVYLSGIHYHTIILNYQPSLHTFHRLYYVLRGIRRTQGNQFSRPPRQPITIANMHSLVQFLTNSNLNGHDQAMVKFAISLAFFGMLRSAEYTTQTQSRYDPTVNLMINDILLSASHQVLVVNIKASKTDPFKVGQTIRIGATNNQLCPILLYRTFINIRNYSLAGPIFTFSNQTFLTRNYISNLINQALPNNVNLNTHSFRIGGATAAAASGIPDSTIQILGRWRSDAYRCYLRFSDEQVQQFTNSMAATSVRSGRWDSFHLTVVDNRV